eukprot:TRINITY_DN3123_c0_g1_i5.p1 TRINITY_DN3123_c0_g1~~TRINITY_DN3123_c0_g1_i5.p1  ORF type:complete len:440 (+),score=77.92 TRINITY_DN3123_c0_g1_i5:29-1321(+)
MLVRPFHLGLALLLASTVVTCVFLYRTSLLAANGDDTPSPATLQRSAINATIYEEEEKLFLLRKAKLESILRKLRLLPNASAAGPVLLPGGTARTAPATAPVSSAQRQKYLFFRWRYGGGNNNQLEELMWASYFAQKIGRGVVLIPFAESVTWDRPQMDHFVPFDKIYDVGVFSQLVPTLPLDEWRKLCDSSIALDIFPTAKQVYMQKQFEDNLKINFRNAKRLLVKSYRDVQGKELPDCLGVQFPGDLIEGAIHRKDYPGDPPIGGLVERDPDAERFRRHVVAARYIHEAVKPITAKLGRYLAVHVRVGDFLKWCGGARGTKCPTYEDMAAQVRSAAAQFNLSRVFVACQPRFLNVTLQKLRNGHPDIIGVAEQQICIDAPVFIANEWSTWSRSVHELRYTGKKKCTTTLIWNSKRPWCINHGKGGQQR